MACVNSVLLLALTATAVLGLEFDVGDGIGWRKPTGKEPDIYNEWAERKRFHIGDSIHFKYQNDSVLEVSAAEYWRCVASSPIEEFDDGDTVFKFERSGLFYFISGQPDHCKSGQRLMVRVMHPLEEQSPAPSPVEHGGGGGGGWDSGELGPPTNSTTKFSVLSYFVTAFIGLFVIFYMFA